MIKRYFHSMQFMITVIVLLSGFVPMFSMYLSVISNHNEYDKTTANIVMVVVSLLLIVAAFIIGFVFTAPFKKLAITIDSLGSGNFNSKINIGGYTETESVEKAFNNVLEKLNRLDESRQEFVSNVSHELKTPITGMKVIADSLVNQDDVPVQVYKEFFNDIAEEINRENKIINDLLSLVRLDKTNNEMQITSVNINELIELILKRIRPIASKKNVELIFESFRPVIAEVDEVKLTLAISNFIENAVKYNKLDGKVRVSLNADYKFFYIKVADTGIGIPENQQDMIFDRFYRVDKARSRQTGGTGLGLAIAKNAIQLHKGAVKVYSKEGEGSTFTIRIPLTYVK